MTDNNLTPISENIKDELKNTPPEFATLGEVTDEEMAKALEGLDLTLPQDYVNETMAKELLTNITAVYTSETAARSARAQGNHKVAEDMAKQAAICRSAAGLIQLKFPGAEPLIEDIALATIFEIRRNRRSIKAALEREE